MATLNTPLSSEEQFDQPQVASEASSPAAITTHSFTTSVQETQIFFHVTKLDSSLMIWIGGNDGCLDELIYSASTPYDKGSPVATDIISSIGPGDSQTSSLAMKLTKKLGKPIFLSCNIPVTNDDFLQHQIQLRLMEEIKNEPSKF